MDEFDDIDLKAKLDGKLWLKVLKLLKPYKKYLIFGIIFCIIMTLMETKIVEYMSQQGIERFIGGDLSDAEFSYKFTWFAIWTGLLILVDIISNKIYFICCYKLEQYLYRDLNNNVFDHLQSLSYSFYDKYSVGWLMARCISDAERVGDIISWGLGNLVWASLKLVFILITMIKYSFSLAIIMMVIVPVLIIVSTLFRRVIVKYFWRVRRINSQVTSALNEGISGAKTSKSLVLEDKNFNEFKGLANKYRKTAVKSVIYTSLYYQSIAFMSAVGIGLMAYFGGNAVNNLILPVGTLYLFISYTTMFFEPVLNIARTTNQMKQAQVSASRIFNLLDVQTEIPDTPEVVEKYGTFQNAKKENWEELYGEVEFEHVDFSYSTGSGRKILSDFNLKVKKGMSIALVGETGAGKSTIVNLLCRFYEPTSGRILIDGKDYKERSVGWLHANLGYVMQTPHLFSGTIMENIRYGNRNATDEEVFEAAKAANAHEFITKLEHGYDTEVGEGGNRLSQGQKQLISFARALVANPKILVLDEATSSIDTETELMIQKAIKNILKGRTSFVIAHRLSTITDSDLILVIQNGMITEQGTHQELLKLKGYYYKLYTNQFIEDKMKELGM